jgi:hypothetical protein
MNKKWMIPALLAGLVLTSCGGSETTETEGTTDSTTTTVEEPKELIKDYNWLSAKLDNISIEGVALTPDLVNDDANNKDIRRSWTVDPATNGCDKIQINCSSLSRSGNQRKELEHKSLAEYQDFMTKYEAEEDKKNFSDFKEYQKDSLVFYYNTKVKCSDTFGPSDYRKITFVHCTADLRIQGWVYVYDATMDMVKAEEMAIKMMDFLSQP